MTILAGELFEIVNVNTGEVVEQVRYDKDFMDFYVEFTYGNDYTWREVAENTPSYRNSVEEFG